MIKCCNSDQESIWAARGASDEHPTSELTTTVLDLRHRLASAQSDLEFQRGIIRALLEKLRQRT